MPYFAPVRPPARRAARRRAALSGVAAAILLGLSTTGARAGDGGTFTADQRKEIVAIVRDALKTDPTILTDAIAALRAGAEAQEQATTRDALAANRAALGTPAPTDAILGAPHARMTIVEFYDPRCPYCRKVLPDLDRLVHDDPDVRIVEKVVAVLGPASLLTAQAIAAAALQGGQDAYFRMQRAIMADSQKPDAARIRTLAAQAGLDPDRLATDMAGSAVASTLRANSTLATAIHLEGTPTFVFDGRYVIPGAVDLDELKAAIAKVRRG
ncbi:DSBA oxidoreductase [Gluconacetobacter diazotrophicus PA1 5]|uniref:DsbA family protein n=1 Tax=Gluconacetobacter diazotrophicus TaxID=33996 RepID=A0A7W4I584_GLUDI|nr:DsbA family protein [Gluconacetobacter diazotrophicus]ACI50309.1 DSBA oxidoreductase [Gluconacetobacter diazotrophicus PA1 5]MBB2154745.1 DsbA family protein [Gluconacetobacter diazotrophicus]TWB08368.1 protein-disulfide isomerase [Gluconacetobacter diazotrophicus]